MQMTRRKPLLLMTVAWIASAVALADQPAPKPQEWNVSFGAYKMHHLELTERIAVAMAQANPGNPDNQYIASLAYATATNIMDLEGIKCGKPAPPAPQILTREHTLYPNAQRVINVAP